jgi:hypothetical protein
MWPAWSIAATASIPDVQQEVEAACVQQGKQQQGIISPTIGMPAGLELCQVCCLLCLTPLTAFMLSRRQVAKLVFVRSC